MSFLQKSLKTTTDNCTHAAPSPTVIQSRASRSSQQAAEHTAANTE